MLSDERRASSLDGYLIGSVSLVLGAVRAERRVAALREADGLAGV